MRIKADAIVNVCLDSQLKRKSKWRGQTSTTVKSHNIFAPIVESTTNKSELQNLQENQP